MLKEAFVALGASCLCLTVCAGDFGMLMRQCAPNVDPQTMEALVGVESGFNPYAIGIVGGALKRQPTSLPEARKAVNYLVRSGRNFSVGLGQINRHNFAKYGLDSETAFDPCKNLKTAGLILADCYARAKRRQPDDQKALRDALSCYYSGNFKTGYRHGYVQRVIAFQSTSSQRGRHKNVNRQKVERFNFSDELMPVETKPSGSGFIF